MRINFDNLRGLIDEVEVRPRRRMTRRLNVGIVGCGRITRMHTPNILSTPEMNVVATMDTKGDAAHDATDKFGAQYHTTSLDRLLSDPEIDAVLVHSFHDTHTEIAIQACNEGKHV